MGTEKYHLVIADSELICYSFCNVPALVSDLCTEKVPKKGSGTKLPPSAIVLGSHLIPTKDMPLVRIFCVS